MAKTATKKKETQKKSEVKKGPGSVIKAKDKHKKSNIKKLSKKIDKDIENINSDFTELQPKLVLEKENLEKMKNTKGLSPKKREEAVETIVSQAKQVEATVQVLANL